MNTSSTGQGRICGHYQIRLVGHLDQRWAGWFDGMTLTCDSDGSTLLEGPVLDQAALHGLLTKLRDIGLPLISVNPLHPDLPQPPVTREGE